MKSCGGYGQQLWSGAVRGAAAGAERVCTDARDACALDVRGGATARASTRTAVVSLKL
jgi:hypothetical protein